MIQIIVTNLDAINPETEQPQEVFRQVVDQVDLQKLFAAINSKPRKRRSDAKKAE